MHVLHKIKFLTISYTVLLYCTDSDTLLQKRYSYSMFRSFWTRRIGASGTDAGTNSRGIETLREDKAKRPAQCVCKNSVQTYRFEKH